MSQGLTRNPLAEPIEGEDHLVKSFEQAPVGVAEVDAEGCFIGVNERFCEITGWAHEELLGRPVSAITHADHIESDNRNRSRLLSGEIGYYETEKRYLRPDGSAVWVDLRVSRIDARGGAGFTIGVVQDISERKWAQERDYGSARMLDVAVNATGLGLWDLVPETGEVQSTRRCWELLGLDHQPTDSEWVAAIHPDDREATLLAFRAILDPAGPRAYRREYRVLHKSGEVRWVNSWAQAIVAQGPDGPRVVRVAGVLQDVSPWKRTEESLEARIAESHADLEHAETALRQSQKMEAVGQLTGGIAHDFNNLLTVILGNLDMMERLEAGRDPQLKRMIDTARRAGERGERLTQQLLAFARRQSLRPETVDVASLIDDLLTLIGRAAGSAVQIETRLGEELWPTHVDPAQFQAAILNLSVNAGDAMPSGGRMVLEARNLPLRNPAAEGFPEASPGEYLLVSVADSGEGMSPETVERAFDPFFSTKPVGKGTGLGLSQVYGFARQSGGHVRIESKPGAGSVITLLLPRSVEGLPPPRPRGLPGAAARGRETILLVEDEPDVRAVTRAALEAEGYEVRVAGDGPGALALLEAGMPVDLLFSDIVMPNGMSGVTLAERALRQRPGLAVLLTSGFPGADVVDGGAPLPYPLLAKPFRPDELTRRIREILDHSAEPAASDGPQDPSPASASESLSILVVEDEALVLLAALDLIEEQGHQALQASNAKSALEQLAGDRRIDVLFTDVRLPDMSGSDLAQQARMLRPDLAVIFATGYDSSTLGDSIDLPRTAFLPKPYRGEGLAEAIKAALGG